MDDRTLLEGAARAAGHTLRAVIQYEDESSWYGLIASGDEYSEDFDPLNDDGDALRLAVKMDMSVKQDDPNASIAGWSNLQRINITHDRQGPWHWKEWLRDHGNDRYAATKA